LRTALKLVLVRRIERRGRRSGGSHSTGEVLDCWRCLRHLDVVWIDALGEAVAPGFQCDPHLTISGFGDAM